MSSSADNSGAYSVARQRALLADELRKRARLARTVVPMSLGQQALWFLHQRNPDSAAYHAAFAVQIHSPVDLSALRQTFQTLQIRHPQLRSQFRVQDGLPVQETLGAQALEFDAVDVSRLNPEELRIRIRRDYLRPFDLTRDSVFRVRLYSVHAECHVLLITVHHIACDAWSIWTLMQEFRQLYPAACRHEPLQLPRPDVGYADFVRWETEQAAGRDGQRSLSYWKDQLSGPLPTLELPTDGPFAPVPALRGESHFFELSTDLTNQLRGVASTHGATMFMLLLAAWQVLLHRYSGQNDVIVGSPTTGRSNADFNNVVGYFVNPIPLRADLSGDPNFDTFLQQVRGTVLSGLKHSDYPFPLLIEKLQPQRVPNRSPVFQTMFVLQKPQSGDLSGLLTAGGSSNAQDWGGLDIEPWQLGQMEGQFDLTLEFVELGSLHGTLKYNPDVFDTATIQRLESSFHALLSAIAADPKISVGRLEIIGPAEKTLSLGAWNETTVSWTNHAADIPQLFEQQVCRTPDAAALEFEDQRLSYSELNVRINQLAHYLRQLGVGPDVPVGVCIERSVELVVALYGVMKAGGAYVPLDPDYPAERLAYMAEDAGFSVLLTQQHLKDQLPPTDARIVCLDGDSAEAVSEHSAQNPQHNLHAENLAYIIYTSGSTGQPKGAGNSHAGIRNRLLWMQDQYGLSAEDCVLQKTPFSFDVSVWEFFWPLITGARLVVAKPGGHRDPAWLVETIADRQVTTMHFVPSMLHAFLDAQGLERCKSLRRVICSGEALSGELQSRFFEHLSGELHNLYGPTEAAIDVTWWECEPAPPESTVPIGRPIANTSLYILDDQLNPVPIGVAGELFIAGRGLARGYWERPGLTADRFLPDPFGESGSRMYRSGDRARHRSDGSIEYLGRLDHQVKIRGFRVELGEIESRLQASKGVHAAAVIAVSDTAREVRLRAFIVPTADGPPEIPALRRDLSGHLPDYMVPTEFTVLKELPLTANGKTNTRALAAMQSSADEGKEPPARPQTEAEQAIASIWREVLGVDSFAVDDNFFELGGHSLLMARVQGRLHREFDVTPSIVEMFRYPTVRSLARHLRGDRNGVSAEKHNNNRVAPSSHGGDVAIVGMSCRFPGAANPDEFWQNLRSGTESITFFTDEELLAAGVPQELLDNPDYVRAFGAVDDIDLFDADFFSISPREAATMDVQHRLLLECAWTALEDAGHDPLRAGNVGVFAGVGMNTYLLHNLLPNRELVESIGGYQLLLRNDKDFVPTRTSYKLNLQGPSVNVQTACSTSLTAVHLAIRSLLNDECDMALAGGCTVRVPQTAGYVYQPDMILSPDGHCRAFDAEAQGTVGGSGAGIVVLKRLDDAQKDGDRVLAVIKGSAMNNDGALKAGYGAPSVDGQSDVIQRAHRAAKIRPESVSYLEAHGTGTAIGDPIEFAALEKAFASDAPSESETGCAVGSVKTNIGHLDSAAGVAGLIKTVLAIQHEEIPPSLHFRHPNPQIDFSESRFFVCDSLRPWTKPASTVPRRAGVSSFGIGGTNVHLVLEEPPGAPKPEQQTRPELMVVSAKTPQALEQVCHNLADHLANDDANTDCADAAFTLSCGRTPFSERRAIVCTSRRDAVDQLRRMGGSRATVSSAPSVAFLFSGQGSQYVRMGAGLYRAERTFRRHVDECTELLAQQGIFDGNLRRIIDPETAGSDAAARLALTSNAQPALFVTEYALARMWMSWGVQPASMLGHSIGEYAAACIAGVFSLEDALAVVVRRGQLMQQMPEGSMLAVSMPAEELRAKLNGRLSIAAVNAPELCVVSGPDADIEAFHRKMDALEVVCRPLHTSHAFHSQMMDPMLDAFLDQLSGCRLNEPSIPFISNVTGTWIQPEEATDPRYWSQHVRQPVRFADGLGTLLNDENLVVLETGPGGTLTGLARRHPRRTDRQLLLRSLPGAVEDTSDFSVLLDSVGRAWTAGIEIDWAAFYESRRCRRVALPTYPFQRVRHWVEAPGRDSSNRALGGGGSLAPGPDGVRRHNDPADWYSIPSWERTLSPENSMRPDGCWVVFDDAANHGSSLIEELRSAGTIVFVVRPGHEFKKVGDRTFEIAPANREHYDRLLQEMLQVGSPPKFVVHLWSVSKPGSAERADEIQERGFFSLLALAQALGDVCAGEECRIAVVSNQLQDVTGREQLQADKATLLGAVQVVPQEYPDLHCVSIDIDVPLTETNSASTGRRIIGELMSPFDETVLAYRGPHRWVQRFVPVHPDAGESVLQEGGVYLITGGTGGLGLALAEVIARTVNQVGLVLTSRTTVPPRDEWTQFLNDAETGSQLQETLQALQRIEGYGAKLCCVAADVADAAQMAQCFDTIQQEFGRLDGVIHAAGISGGGTIPLRTRESVDAEFSARLDGTRVLEPLLDRFEPEFLVLCSSQTAITGGFGQIAYAAATSYLDALARARARQGDRRPHVRSINWDRWQGVGMAIEAESLHRQFTGSELRPGISVAEGQDAFLRILMMRDVPQVIVSAHSFSDIVQRSRTPFSDDRASEVSPVERHARPALRNTLEPPQTDLEREIADLWQNELGIEQIGRTDDFFELGGDSLIAIRLNARLRESLQVNLTVRSIYDQPTVGSLARHVEALRWTNHNRGTVESGTDGSEEELEQGIL